MSEYKYHFETIQLHSGQENADPATDSRAVPIYQTTSYVFHNSDHAEARFNLTDAGNIYGRLTNSTQGVLEKRVADLEDGVGALAVASGAAALAYTFQALAKAGSHIVAAKTIYGGTYNYLAHTLPGHGVETTFVDPDDLQNFENAIQPNTRAVLLRDTGAAISPFNAFLLLQGIETLSLRLDRHIENTKKVLEFLQNHPKVESINHPSLDPRYKELYNKYFPNGAGSIFTFNIKGGEKEAKAFIDNLKIFSLLANVADVKSLVIHPKTTTHSQLSQEEFNEQRIFDNTIRLSIGTEHIDDIIYDLSQAFDKI